MKSLHLWNSHPGLTFSDLSVTLDHMNMVGSRPSDQECLLMKVAEMFPGGLHHEPLENRCIRLIDIQNAHFTGNVLQGFRLVTVPLADAPLFDALSYCWGDMRLCTGIVFDTGTGPCLVERMFRVTEDLATCLFSILMTRTLEEKPRYLWIDQVSFITIIYTNCI
jgi:hypothetical protein